MTSTYIHYLIKEDAYHYVNVLFFRLSNMLQM